VVDDLDKCREFSALILGAFPDGKVIVEEAVTGVEGVAIAELLTPDLILLGIFLPDGNGFDVAKKIRQVSPDSRVIFVTANTDDLVQAIHAMEEGPIN